MGLLDIFKSSAKAVDAAAGIADKTADGIIAGIDKAFYTDEEKAEARQKWFSGWLALQQTIANESTPTAISRRVLAFMIMGVFLSLIVLGIALWKIDREWSRVVFDGVDRLEWMATAVAATYFIKDALVKTAKARK